MASQDQAHALLQLISEGFVLVDADFRILDINETGLEMAGRGREEFIGRTLWDFVPALENSELRAQLGRVLADGEPVSLEHLHTWKDGRQSCLEIRAHRCGDRLAIFYRDVTEDRRSREELKRAQGELMHASRISAMETMAATLGHELAQPLVSVRNYAETARKLLRGFGDPKAREARRAVDFAIDATDRASELVKRLRAFVSKGRAETRTNDLHAIVGDAGVLMLPHAQQAGVVVDFRLDPRARWVKADELQIQQVLVNLIRNAIEALDESEERRIVVSAAVTGPSTVEVAVEDSGPGVDPGDGDALFTAFRSGKAGGLGIGLSLSRTIVEAHGGAMSVDSAPGGGALFRFTLARAPAPY